MAQPTDLALMLFQLADEISAVKGQEEALFDERVGEAFPKYELNEPRNNGNIAKLIDELDTVLTRSDWSPNSVYDPRTFNQSWSFGRITEHQTMRKIYGGFVKPVRVIPIVKQLPEIVVHFLITFPRARDYLDREHHDAIGWHYHYLDRKKRRSDTILCWDTRWTESKSPGTNPPRPLFQESHGEGHAQFAARADYWGETKRKSMHKACAVDLQKWPISEFRCAANKSIAVWPNGTTLTLRNNTS